MKPTHIVAIVVIAIAVGVLISSMGSVTEYVDFATAQEMYNKGKDKSLHIVGTLPKDNSGKVVGMQYEPRLNPNLFIFEMIDNKGVKEKVYYNDAKPQDFERSEQIVIIGSYNKEKKFIAKQILMKCPSKYEGEQKKI
ncbi:cytochrome c maturation protein CcmE domain-containing protein [Raineya orbicola]|jgi:cytochrome c-type biogenesis protein CcmE|uniref:CcmE n=1 Tax=Raineya orbicola TaxID=2016530 RepID=A0A2N3IBG7_9BACT|nr:cytochrome c maturation protein CcmE [Raineya orbicola]PKQ67661.1 CcmE [Raineya orbicola]